MVTKGALDLNDAQFLRDRRESYRKLRQQPPAVSLVNGEEVVVLSRFVDVDHVLRDVRARVQPAEDQFPAYLGDGPAAKLYRLSLPSIDPSLHTRLRKILTPALGPRALSAMEPWVNDIIDRRINEIDERVFDVYEKLGSTIPVDVPCRLLHIPQQDAPMLLEKLETLGPVFGEAEISPQELADADSATQYLFDYFSDLYRHADFPDDDFVGALLRAEARGELDRDELLTQIIDIFLGSFHTTRVSFTNVVRSLAMFPEQRRALIQDHSLAGRAWDEGLRYEPPNHFRHRYFFEPVEVGGRRIEAGTRILLGLASANWDEDVFHNPDVFDIGRPAGRHLAFGGGAHFCLGSQLSRLEGRAFLPKFLNRFPDYRLTNLPHPRFEALTMSFSTRLDIEIEAGA